MAACREIKLNTENLIVLLTGIAVETQKNNENMKCDRVPRPTVVEADGFVAGGRGDEVELGELHVAGNVHPPALPGHENCSVLTLFTWVHWYTRSRAV